jgi:hypothetical protein
MGAALTMYEFRILTARGNIRLATQEIHLTDTLAIREARKMAAGDPFEVWRGIKCIHAAGIVAGARDEDGIRVNR